jgi:Na+-driven multidrug efflux pump
MSYLKREPINDFNDISYVNPDFEQKPIIPLILEIVSDSIFYIYPTLILVILESANLIFLGQMADDQVQYKYLNFMAIGTCYLNLFGFAYALGVTKAVKRGNDISCFFHNTKIILIGLTILVILPLSLVSYYILAAVYSNEGPETLEMLWYTYKNFLFLSPIYAFFQLLLQLNMRALQVFDEVFTCFWLFMLNTCFHCVFLYVFVCLLNLNIIGVTISLILSSFLSYIYSNSVLNDYLEIKKNFYFLPDLDLFTSQDSINEFTDVLKNGSLAGIVNYAEYSGYGFFLLLSFFINSESLTTNIVLMNFFAILHTVGHGFSYTLRYYIRMSISSHKHSHAGKKKFVRLISFLVFFLALMVAVVILIFDESIVNLYLRPIVSPLSTQNLNNLFSDIANIYALVIFFDYFSWLLDGYIKGSDAKTTHLLIYKISFVLVFVPAGLILCFVLGMGLKGFWISIYVYIVIYALINGLYAYKSYNSYSIWFNSG